MLISMYRYAFLIAMVSVLVLAGFSSAAYNVTKINTTVSINANGSAYVTDVLYVRMSNTSVQQYTIDRSGLNLTLSDWQSLVGPSLVPHIMNRRSGIYGFGLLPGPVVLVDAQNTASIYMHYYVSNIATINQTGPRTYEYAFNASDLNFAQGVGGVVLGQNMRLNIILPNGSSVLTVYPLPDSPSQTQNLTSAERLSWYAGEPLYSFELIFQLKTSTTSEVLGFFGSIYSALGSFVYVIIGGAVLLFIIYTYLKIGR